MSDIKLGDEIEDVTSKSRGIAVGKVEYLNGAICYVIQPPAVDSTLPGKIEIESEYAKKVSDGVRSIKKRVGFDVVGATNEPRTT